MHEEGSKPRGWLSRVFSGETSPEPEDGVESVADPDTLRETIRGLERFLDQERNRSSELEQTLERARREAGEQLRSAQTKRVDLQSELAASRDETKRWKEHASRADEALKLANARGKSKSEATDRELETLRSRVRTLERDLGLSRSQARGADRERGKVKDELAAAQRRIEALTAKSAAARPLETEVLDVLWHLSASALTVCVGDRVALPLSLAAADNVGLHSGDGPQAAIERLARWLRPLGFQTTAPQHQPDGGAVLAGVSLPGRVAPPGGIEPWVLALSRIAGLGEHDGRVVVDRVEGEVRVHWKPDPLA